MKIKKLIPLFISLFLISACGHKIAPTPNPDDPDIPVEPEIELDNQTILIYMSGANYESRYANESTIPGSEPAIPWDGCGYATKCIQDILSVPNKPDDVNIVIMTGGSTEWTTKENGHYGDYDIDASKIQIHHVGSDNKLYLDATFNISSMGDWSTFEKFIEYGLNAYPAERFGLVFWGHGAGTQGVCYDYNYVNTSIGEVDSLSLNEMYDGMVHALHNSPFWGKKLEWVGYDCSYSALQDLATNNYPFFKYMVASQEVKEAYGWNYAEWIDDVYAKKDTLEILKAICDSSMNYVAGPDQDVYDNQTRSILDLSKIVSYYDAFEDFAIKLGTKVRQATKDAFNECIINNVKYFGATSYIYYGHFDVKSFVSYIASEANTDFRIDTVYTDNVLATLSDLVIYETHESGNSDCCGLSLFWICSHYARAYTPYGASDTDFYYWAMFNYVYGAS